MANKLTPGSNMRWESMRMILPEHREQWLKHQEKAKKSKKPVLDEQQWEEFEWLLSEAIQEKEELKFTYWEDGYFYDVIGYCHYINTKQKQFHIKNDEDEVNFISFDQIIDIKRAGSNIPGK
ncbi:REP element-mobilizing transposase RayT [Salibacterium salarium]|uniref:YolD-like family protein n=1 Tax=Salibacterium salarium TaxID=284579 RepID=UPI002781F8BC|nr:YolD-like family protein [Salibacterium salarium]MDQ0299619.1 REP element-mobilizing transposase RayT [Salibacterium salarium]